MCSFLSVLLWKCSDLWDCNACWTMRSWTNKALDSWGLKQQCLYYLPSAYLLFTPLPPGLNVLSCGAELQASAALGHVASTLCCLWGQWLQCRDGLSVELQWCWSSAEICRISKCKNSFTLPGLWKCHVVASLINATNSRTVVKRLVRTRRLHAIHVQILAVERNSHLPHACVCVVSSLL